MAMSCVIRKASPPVVPLAIRAISFPRINFTAGSFPNAITSSDYNYKFGIPNYSELKEPSFLSNHFSTSAAASVDDYNNVDHKKFVKVLRSEIKLAKRLDSKKRVLSIPLDFPFTIIEENHRNDFITLKRMLHGENIEVMVDMPSLIKKEEEELDSDVSSSDDEEEKEKSITTPSVPTVPMSLSITKENGDSLDIWVLASSDEVIVKDLWLRKNCSESSTTYVKGPKFKTMASDVRYCLKKLVKNIGIEGSNVEFLYKYMVRKSKRNEMVWMEELKTFVRSDTNLN